VPISWTRRSSPTTDGRALDTIALTREFDHEEDERRRAARVSPTPSRKRSQAPSNSRHDGQAGLQPKGRIKAFAIEPEVTINNNWSTATPWWKSPGSTPRPRCSSHATLSKLNLNIASAQRGDLRRTRGRRVLQ
jgi:[protein-PII] uridylyltransferase